MNAFSSEFLPVSLCTCQLLFLLYNSKLRQSQRCQFSGNFLISGNFARNFLISGNFALHKKIGKYVLPEIFWVLQEILTVVTGISESEVNWIAMASHQVLRDPSYNFKTNAAFHTSLPLCSANAACSFIVRALRHCRDGLIAGWHHSRDQQYEICRCGQSSKVIDLLAKCYLQHGHLWASSGACAVVQISPSKQESIKLQASLKAALLITCKIWVWHWW